MFEKNKKKNSLSEDALKRYSFSKFSRTVIFALLFHY